VLVLVRLRFAPLVGGEETPAVAVAAATPSLTLMHSAAEEEDEDAGRDVGGSGYEMVPLREGDKPSPNPLFTNIRNPPPLPLPSPLPSFEKGALIQSNNGNDEENGGTGSAL
jgi:hypothetical protein